MSNTQQSNGQLAYFNFIAKSSINKLIKK